MRSLPTAGCLAATLLSMTAALSAAGCARSAQADEARPAGPAQPQTGAVPVPVLVELFTSEGCSSCPAAEEEVLRLESEQPVVGAQLIPVAFHVDYWDDLGWPDPFASAAWTDRQRDHDRGTGRVYTPQAVVQGGGAAGGECVGSDDRALRALVSRAAETPAATLSVTASLASPTSVRVSVGVPAHASRGQAELQVVLVERGVVVDVPRGENGGRRLRHAPLARALVDAGAVTVAGGTLEALLGVPAGARREHLEVVAVAEDPASHRVVGLGVTRLSP